MYKPSHPVVCVASCLAATLVIRCGNDTPGQPERLQLSARGARLIDTRVPFTAEFVNPCNGELVPLEGYVHFVDRTTIDGAGGVHGGTYLNTQGIHGVGATTGAKYTSIFSDDFSAKVQYGEEVTEVLHQFIIGQGDVPDFEAHAVLHITVNANGDMTAFVDNFSAECRG